MPVVNVLISMRILDVDENDEQYSSDEDDPDHNRVSDDVILSGQEPFYEHEYEEGFDLDDLEYDTLLNRADNSIN